jgi:hypothetical protein
MASKQSRYVQKREAGLVPHAYTFRRTIRRAKELGIDPNTPTRQRRRKGKKKEGKHLDTLKKLIRKKEGR